MNALLSSVLQHLRIAGQLARVGVVRKSQFKVEFWCQVLMDCCWYAAHVSVFEILFTHTREIAGWNRESFRVLIGFLFVSDAFMMVWLGQMWRFGRDLKDGKLDPFRVRPASALVLYGFSQFSLEGCVNMTIALGYLTYAIGRALPHVGVATLFITLAAISLSFWARCVVITLFSLLDLAMIGSDFGRFMYDMLHATTDRPADIFDRRLRVFLLYVVPMGALCQVPAQIVLGRYTPLEALGAAAWLIALGLAVFAAWKRGFRRYESAMG